MRYTLLFSFIILCQFCLRDAFESMINYDTLDSWIKMVEENRKVSQFFVKGNQSNEYNILLSNLGKSRQMPNRIDANETKSLSICNANGRQSS